MKVIIKKSEYKRLKKIEENYKSKRTIIESEVFAGSYCVVSSKTIFTEDEAVNSLVKRIQSLNEDLAKEKSRKWYQKLFN